MFIECPLCHKVMDTRGLQFHLRNKHPKEYNEVGYQKIKEQAKKMKERPPGAAESPKKVETPSKKTHKPAPTRKLDEMVEGDISEGHEEDRAIDAWDQKTRQKIWFTPTPASSMVINQFGSATNPSDTINTALHEFARSRGMEPAIVKTKGGKELSLLGGNNDDKEFNRLLKIMQIGATQNQSYNQYSPPIQMMQMMRERVSKGVSMGDFMKDIMKMKMQSEMMRGQQSNPMAMMMMMNRLNARRRR